MRGIRQRPSGMKHWILTLLFLPALASFAAETPAPAAADAGWVALVDGKSATTQAHFTAFGEKAFPAGGWTVEADGSLHGHGGPDLISKESYGDFEMELEWKVAPGGNSGVFYRIAPMAGEPIYENAFECQVYGPENMAKCHPVYRPGALYNLFGNETLATIKPVGEWNTVRIEAKGGHLVHWMNGVKVVDARLDSPAYAAKLARSKFAKVAGYGAQKAGPIGLQSDGGEVWYRNVRIRGI